MASRAILLALATLASVAEEWPQFLGPRRDGSSNDEIALAWPKEGPAKTWEKRIGDGFAGPAVSGGKLFLFHRSGNEEKVECFDAASGGLIWASGYPSTYRDDFGFDPGPRAVPLVSGDKVFTYGADGVISATSVPDGKTAWRLDAKKEFGSPKGYFGRASSPLIFGTLLLLNAGGSGGGIVALDAATGKLRWRAGEDEASYSSPTLAVFSGKTNAVFVTRNELISIDPIAGKVMFKFPFEIPMRASVTAAAPLVNGDLVFVSASYGLGAAALRIDGNQPKKLWAADAVLSNHYATSVHQGGFLYGFDGRQEQGPSLTCVEWATGKPRWRKQMPAGSILIVKEKLLLLLETGELVLAEASPVAFKELARAQVLGAGTRACPALANGFLYARSKDRLIRLDLR